MKIPIFLIVVGAILLSCEAKRKRKFEGDFEFAEEVSESFVCIDASERCDNPP